MQKINEAIIKARVELQKTNLKKSGRNRFANFDYYELADFLPTLNIIMERLGINDIFTIEDGYAKLTLIKGENMQSYAIPFVMFDVPKNKNGQPSMQQIQYLGALNTYYKRYLYLNAFGITDGEVIDSMDNSNLQHEDDILELEALINKTPDVEKTKVWILKTYNVPAINDLDRGSLKSVINILKQRLTS